MQLWYGTFYIHRYIHRYTHRYKQSVRFKSVFGNEDMRNIANESKSESALNKGTGSLQ
jgi:hypothetical protein